MDRIQVMRRLKEHTKSLRTLIKYAEKLDKFIETWIMTEEALTKALSMFEEETRLRKELSVVRKQYHELLMAVGIKVKNVTRHETALGYILEAEKRRFMTIAEEAMDKACDSTKESNV